LQSFIQIKKGKPAMHPTLRLFLREYLGIVFAALVPVVMTAFLSIPVSLGGHPGEPRIAAALTDQHMS